MVEIRQNKKIKKTKNYYVRVDINNDFRDT